MKYYVYMVECADGTLYTGIARDIAKRIAEHNTSPKGAKYTRSRRPVKLVYSEIKKSRSGAQKREAEIKKLSRVEKEILCGSSRSKIIFSHCGSAAPALWRVRAPAAGADRKRPRSKK